MEVTKKKTIFALNLKQKKDGQKQKFENLKLHLKNNSNKIYHEQLKLRPYFLPRVSKNRLHVYQWNNHFYYLSFTNTYNILYRLFFETQGRKHGRNLSLSWIYPLFSQRNLFSHLDTPFFPKVLVLEISGRMHARPFLCSEALIQSSQ